MSESSLQIFILPATAAAPPDATMAMCAAMLAGDWPQNYILFTLDSAAAQKQAAYGGKMADNSSPCRGFIFFSLFIFFICNSAVTAQQEKHTEDTHNLSPEVIGAEISCRTQRDQTASHWLFLIHQFLSLASLQSLLETTTQHVLQAILVQWYAMLFYAMLSSTANIHH